MADRILKLALGTGISAALFLLTAGFWLATRTAGQDSDLDVPCLYCHMPVVAEVKLNASRHWEAGIRCETCHGPSTDHIDVEDNSVPPDRVWDVRTAHKLCGKCHQASFESYRIRPHASLIMALEPDSAAPPAPNCSTCHGFHGLKSEPAIKKVCVGCHTQLPAACSSPRLDVSPDSFYCKECHESHSLHRVKGTFTQPQRRGRP